MENFLMDIRQEMEGYYDTFVVLTPRFLLSCLILMMVWFLSARISRFSQKRLKKRMDDPLLAEFLIRLFRFVIVVAGLLVALRIMGFGGIVTGILAGAGITAFVIGFALRDIGENFLAGLLLAFKRPFRIGDRVESGGFRGEVVALSIRDTRLKTPDGRDVFVPNAHMIKMPLVNFTLDGFLRFDVTFSLPDGLDVRNLLRQTEDAVGSISGVSAERTVEADIVTHNPASLEMVVRYWVNMEHLSRTEEQIRTDVNLVLREILQHANSNAVDKGD